MQIASQVLLGILIVLGICYAFAWITASMIDEWFRTKCERWVLYLPHRLIAAVIDLFRARCNRWRERRFSEEAKLLWDACWDYRLFCSEPMKERAQKLDATQARRLVQMLASERVQDIAKYPLGASVLLLEMLQPAVLEQLDLRLRNTVCRRAFRFYWHMLLIEEPYFRQRERISDAFVQHYQPVVDALCRTRFTIHVEMLLWPDRVTWFPLLPRREFVPLHVALSELSTRYNAHLSAWIGGRSAWQLVGALIVETGYGLIGRRRSEPYIPDGVLRRWLFFLSRQYGWVKAYQPQLLESLLKLAGDRSNNQHVVTVETLSRFNQEFELESHYPELAQAVSKAADRLRRRGEAPNDGSLTIPHSEAARHHTARLIEQLSTDPKSLTVRDLGDLAERVEENALLPLPGLIHQVTQVLEDRTVDVEAMGDLDGEIGKWSLKLSLLRMMEAFGSLIEEDQTDVPVEEFACTLIRLVTDATTPRRLRFGALCRLQDYAAHPWFRIRAQTLLPLLFSVLREEATFGVFANPWDKERLAREGEYAARELRAGERERVTEILRAMGPMAFREEWLQSLIYHETSCLFASELPEMWGANFGLDHSTIRRLLFLCLNRRIRAGDTEQRQVFSPVPDEDFLYSTGESRFSVVGRDDIRRVCSLGHLMTAGGVRVFWKRGRLQWVPAELASESRHWATLNLKQWRDILPSTAVAAIFTERQKRPLSPEKVTNTLDDPRLRHLQDLGNEDNNDPSDE